MKSILIASTILLLTSCSGKNGNLGLPSEDGTNAIRIGQSPVGLQQVSNDKRDRSSDRREIRTNRRQGKSSDRVEREPIRETKAMQSVKEGCPGVAPSLFKYDLHNFERVVLDREYDKARFESLGYSVRNMTYYIEGDVCDEGSMDPLPRREIIGSDYMLDGTSRTYALDLQLVVETDQCGTIIIEKDAGMTIR